MKGNLLVNMNIVQNIVVIAGQNDNPSKLKTKLEPIKLSQHFRKIIINSTKMIKIFHQQFEVRNRCENIIK